MLIAFYSAIVLVSLGSAVFIFWPWIEAQAKIKRQSVGFDSLDQYQNLVHESENHFETLRDLELDYQMEKLSDEDYQSLKSETVQKLAVLLQEIQQLEKSDSFFQSVEQDLSKVSEAGSS